MRNDFVHADPEMIYLDGNSLGRLPVQTIAAMQDAIENQWGGELIEAWDHWIDLPTQLGDTLARQLLGAAPGSVVVSDSTTVNFYKLAVAALDARPDRTEIVTDRGNFPTDRYVVEGLAQARGATVRWVDADPIEGPSVADVEAVVGEQTALVTFSHADYRSAALADMAKINEVAHAAGALTLWDLSHSAGAVPIELAADDCDLAVGCTYKYLNGGPGSPAFLYVRPDLHAQLRQPIWGWFGQQDQFAMGKTYRPVESIARFTAGTPPILALAAAKAGIESITTLGIARLREQSVALTEQLIAETDEHLAPLGFTVASPRDSARRGGHVLLSHDEAKRISKALRVVANVVGDFRQPNGLRLAPVPAYIDAAQVSEAVRRIASVVRDKRYEDVDANDRVT